MAERPSVFPSILPSDTNQQFVDTHYQRRELERKDYQELREIAAEHPSEDVNGRMDQESLVDGLEGLERVDA